ncbi:MAG: trigger factor [Thermodesulfobacteriota bacterium]
MQIAIEDVSSLTKKMKITLPADLVGKRLDAAYDEIRGEVSIKGFRKGKAPRVVMEKNFGGRVKQDVAEQLIKDTYFDALQESKLDAVVHPNINRHEYLGDGGFYYEALVDIRPEFELGDYRSIEVEVEEIHVDEATVDAAIEKLRREHAPLISVTDRPSREGDIVVVDFQGYHEGEAMKQVTGSGYSVEIGSGSYGKDFEDALIGLGKGETATREITFPAGFVNPVMAGKTISFEISVVDLQQRVLPELNDEFAKDVDEQFATLAQLREHIRAQEIKKREERQQGDIADRIMKKLLEMHDFEAPERLVIYEAEMMVKEMEQNLLRQGVNIETAGLNREKLAENYRTPAAMRVRGDFIIKKISEKEEIKVVDTDIEEGFKRIAGQYGMAVDEVRRYFRAREDLMPFINELLNEKVLQFLRDSVTIKRTAPAEAAAVEVQEA